MTKEKILNIWGSACLYLFFFLAICVPLYFVLDALTGHFEFNYNKFKHDVEFATKNLKPFVGQEVPQLGFEIYIDSVCKANKTLSLDFFRDFEITSLHDRIKSPDNVTITSFSISQSQWDLLSKANEKNYRYLYQVSDRVELILGSSLWQKFKYKDYIVEKPTSYFLTDILSTILSIGFVILVPLCIVMFFVSSSYQAKKKKVEQDAAIINARDNAQNKPDEILPVWDVAQKTLDRYYTRNLDQIKWVFWLSVCVMIAGFALICYGLYRAIEDSNSTLVTIVASASGIITEFIGLTFIFIYKSTIRQAFKYTDSLEKMNTVGMSMKILDTFNVDEADQQKVIDAKIEMAKLLIQQSVIISKE